MENFDASIVLDTYRRAFRFCQILALPAPEAGAPAYSFEVRTGMINMPSKRGKKLDIKEYPMSRAQWEKAVAEIRHYS